MKSMSSVIGAVTSVLLIGAGAALYYLTPPDRDGQFRTAIGAAQKMQQLGAQWGVETARVRADPSANFDGLADFVPRMKAMRKDFSKSLAQIPELSDRVAADARAYVAAMESLRERVERFKTAYAVIRNSERYLPLASAELIERAQNAGDGELAREIASITQELSAFLVASSESERERLSERVARLEETSVRKTSVLASAISNFVAHANVLLDKQGRTDELFQGITSNSLSERLKPLTENLEVEQDKRRRTIVLHQQGMAALGAGVLVTWLVIGFARRSSQPTRAPLATASASPSVPAVPAVPADADADAEPALVSLPRGETTSPGVDPQRLDTPARPTRQTGADLVQDLQSTGALAGLLGQSMGAYTRRMSEDLDAIRNSTAGDRSPEESEEVAQRWRRVVGDIRRLGFFAQRMVVLAKHLAPNDRGLVDVNGCLDEILNDAAAGVSCAVERHFEAIAQIHASKTEIQLICAACIDFALHALRDMDSAEAKLEVATAAEDEGVTISFIHNGGWLPPEQRRNQFVPFYASQDQRAGIELPAALYLAKKNRGTVSIDTLSDERTCVRVRLPATTRAA